MRTFHELGGWNPGRDSDRRESARKALGKSGIEFTEPSPGHFKILSGRCFTLMFYPKSGKLVWKEYRNGRQHIFQNDDEGVIVRKIIELSQ